MSHKAVRVTTRKGKLVDEEHFATLHEAQEFVASIINVLVYKAERKGCPIAITVQLQQTGEQAETFTIGEEE